MANGNGIGKLKEEQAVLTKRIENLETAVERSNRRLEEVVEQGFVDLRADMARLMAVLEKKTTTSLPMSPPTRSISLD